MDFVFVKEPYVGTKTKISGINLSEIYNERLKELVESDLDVSSNHFDLVFGGRIMKEDKTPKEYKIINGSTVFMLRRTVRDDKRESLQIKNVRVLEFTELLRHERMQDLIVAVITDPNLVGHITAENEEDVAALSNLKKLLRSRHFIGLLRGNTFEMVMDTPELLRIGQQIIDKCITDMRHNGQAIPDSDAQMIEMLEDYLSVDYMEDEEVTGDNQDITIGEEETSQVSTNTSTNGQLPIPPPPPVVLPPIATVAPQQRQQPQGLFTAEMLASALQGSNTSSPVSDPPTYSAEQSRSPPVGHFSRDNIREALEGVIRPPGYHHHRRSGNEGNRRVGQSSSRREEHSEYRREREERRERRESHRRHNVSELSQDTTAHLIQTYQTELEQLKLMGIRDEILAVQVLQATAGDVNTTAEILFS